MLRAAAAANDADLVLMLPDPRSKLLTPPNSERPGAEYELGNMSSALVAELERTFTKIVRVPWVIPPGLSHGVPISGGCCGAREFMKIHAVSRAPRTCHH